MDYFDTLQISEAEIINNKKLGVIYTADFPKGKGKYISIAESGSVENADVDIKISSRIHLRITYITNLEKISGVEIAKVDGSNVEKLHFSTLDFEKIIQLLSVFSKLDLKSVANKSIILDQSIVGDLDKTTRFLTLIATDPKGKLKFAEVAQNFDLISVGDINDIIMKKEAVSLFDKLLNKKIEFEEYKKNNRISKDEEVWQSFFKKNSWLLGSDFIKVLDERTLNVQKITDFLLKSFDGFVDIIELKLPSAPFWTSENIPSSDLTKASMQCIRYVLETEKNINSLEFSKKIQSTPIVKPRVTLIYGRSIKWNAEQKQSYRVLNSNYTNINIMTYDHLLDRAKRLLDGEKLIPKKEKVIRNNELPF